MKTMDNNFSLWGNMFMLLAGLMLTSAEAAVPTEPQVTRVSLPQKLLYKVNSKTLEELKESLIQVNLHMRQSANRIKPNIRLAFSGEGIAWLQNGLMDEELKKMLEWFRDEEVQVGLDQNWIRKLNLKEKDLNPDFEILHFQSSTPKED